MYALVEIAAQPTETLPAGAVMEIWYAHENEPAIDGHAYCFRAVSMMFEQDLESVGLSSGTMAVTTTTDEEDGIAYLVEWTMPGRSTRRFRIQELPY